MPTALHRLRNTPSRVYELPMPKKVNFRRIKVHRTYTISETSIALKVHKNTVSSWIKNEGLQAIKDQRPWLISGFELRAFGERQSKAKKRKLLPNQLYCFSCHKGHEPDGLIADFVPQTLTSGMLKGICGEHATIMNRTMRMADIEKKAWKLAVEIKAA